jgi:hypothetical protein
VGVFDLGMGFQLMHSYSTLLLGYSMLLAIWALIAILHRIGVIFRAN